MTGWTIITAGTDNTNDLLEHFTLILEDHADRFTTGRINDNPYFILTGGPRLIDIAQDAVESCPIDCEWLTIVNDNDTDHNEHLWVYLPYDPLSHTNDTDTNYTCVDTYHKRVAERFYDIDERGGDHHEPNAYSYANYVYDIEIRSYPYEDGGVTFQPDAVDTEPEQA